MTDTDTKSHDDVDQTTEPTPDDETTAHDDADAAQDQDALDDDAQDQGDEAEDDDADDEPVSEPVDQGPALRAGGTLNIGLCHFGGADEPASILATREDGTGWIAVCSEHTKDAEEQGYVLEDESKRQSEDQTEAQMLDASGGTSDGGGATSD